MAELVQVRKSPDHAGSEAESSEPAKSSSDSAEKLKADIDAMLDSIDEVLEQNAEEVVRSYVQKGGQ
jgi:ubiquitin-like protein Pup